MELLNAAMVGIGANIRSGNPIVSTWIKENQIAFLEFRTPEEANNAFKLNDLPLLDQVILTYILNQTIKIGRPKNTGEEYTISYNLFMQ
jgi:hypothetical protein